MSGVLEKVPHADNLLKNAQEMMRGGQTPPIISAKAIAPGDERHQKNRAVFISCSSLMRQFKDIPKPVLENSLFFFGSKRRWLFPADKAEQIESDQQPGGYGHMNPYLKKLIAEKEKKGQVHFLKRDDLLYARYPGPKDCEAFARASSWFENLGYPPLQPSA